jgi:hypothetical protein
VNGITSRINKLVEDFQNKEVEIVKGYTFNQAKTLRLIELYSNSKFETGDMDSQGFKKFFYNINQFPVDIEAKATDIDTKDYLFLPEAGRNKDILGSFFMKKEFDVWTKENKWGSKLNEIIKNRPKYGSVVVKKFKNTIKTVNIHNIVCDPTVEYLWKGPVIENHIWTAQELLALPYDEDKKQEVIDLYEKNQEENQIIGREFYGWVKLGDIEDQYKGAKDRAAYCVVIAAGVEKVKKDRDEEQNLGIVLYWKEIKAPEEGNLGDFPYRETHRRKIAGRWLGVGKVEELFDPQIRINELQNIKGKGLYWSSMFAFQSRDATVARNLLEDLVNGEILRVDSEITPINTGRVDLNAFQQEENRWDKNIQERSFTFESETGESMPSGTPFRLGALLSAKSGGFFKLQREDIGLFLVDLFYEVMVPLFRKDRRKKHMIMLPADEKGMEERVNEIVEWLLQEEINAGLLPANLEERRAQVREKVLSKGFLPIEIPESYYDDVEMKIKLVITDEQTDIAQRLETLTNLFTVVAQDPTRPPEQKDALLRGIMQLAGVNPSDYGMNALAKPVQPMPMPEMGATPPMTGMAVPTNITNTTTE